MNKKLMAVFIGLLSLFFVSVYIIAINFDSVKNRYEAIKPDLDNYSAAEILYLSFEKMKTTFLTDDNVDTQEFKIKRMVLKSKINILNNHATFSDSFFYDNDFLSSLKTVQEKNNGLDIIFTQYSKGKISKKEVLQYLKIMEGDIVDLQEVIYRIQIQNFNEVTSVIANNAWVAEVFAVLSLGLFFLIVFLFMRNSYVLKGIIRSKNLFISSIYHELATSMQKIVMSVELIEDDNNFTGHKEELGMISYHAGKVIEQTRDILDYSRIEIGELQTALSSFSLSNLISDALKSVNNRGVNTIRFYDFTNISTIVTDKYKVYRILVNIIDNACKNTKYGVVLIKLCSAPDGFEISIIDNGVGLDIKKVNKYFEAFNQEVKSETKQGLGLGLTIVRKYLDLLSGTIKVHSVKGEGSTFIVYLPVKLNKHHV